MTGRIEVPPINSRRRIESGLCARRRSQHQSKPIGPRITVITVVRNGKGLVEDTIQSVLGQTYANIEYIIIDGASNDGTVDIIKTYEDRIDHWQSELDRGIYDAMNKGVKAASGEWINFMNAGDRFYRPDTVETIFGQNCGGAELIYGHQQIIYHDSFSVIRKSLPVEDLWKGVICNHQAMFVKTALLKAHPFDLSYRIAADFEFVYDAYKRSRRFYRSDTVVASILSSGFSHENLLQGFREYREIVKKHDAGISIDLYYDWKTFFASLKIILKRVLPAKMSERIISLKNR